MIMFGIPKAPCCNWVNKFLLISVLNDQATILGSRTHQPGKALSLHLPDTVRMLSILMRSPLVLVNTLKCGHSPPNHSQYNYPVSMHSLFHKHSSLTLGRRIWSVHSIPDAPCTFIRYGCKIWGQSLKREAYKNVFSLRVVNLWNSLPLMEADRLLDILKVVINTYL